MDRDPTVVAAHAYSLIEENDRVRILKYRLGPGEVTAMHWHPDHVAVTQTPARFRFTTPDGDTSEVEVGEGEVFFVGEGAHTTENLGEAEAYGFDIEIK